MDIFTCLYKKLNNKKDLLERKPNKNSQANNITLSFIRQ
nr:MAG TPA: hypothetical protein [Caudoviricetes sp.]